MVRLLALLAVSVPAVALGNPMLHQQDTRIMDGKGAEVKLRGVSLGGWLVWEGWIFGKGILTPHATIVDRLEKAVGAEKTRAFRGQVYDRFITEADIERVAQAGFNCVRVPLHYRMFDDESGWKLLDRLLDRTRRHRLYAILDLHNVPGTSIGQMEPEHIWKSEKTRTRVVELWKAIATRYHDRRDVAGYDLLNEPLPPSGKALVDVYRPIIQAIRGVDREHMLVIEGGKFSSDFTMFDKPPDSNVVYSFHMYTWFGDDREKKMAEYHALAQRQNVPLWVGEFGENTYAMIESTVDKYERCPEVVGWCFWTWKKAPNRFPGLVTVRVPQDWATTIGYCASLLGGNPPKSATAEHGMHEFVEAMQLKNCDYDKRLEQALLRPRR